jgi:hypothetical protein
VYPKNFKKQKSLSGNTHYLLKLFFLRRFFFSPKRKSGKIKNSSKKGIDLTPHSNG